MKNGFAELAFILDRSGSMAGLESDTVGGFNSMLNKQKQEQGDAIVTTVLFDDRYELLHDRANICGISGLTARDYWVRGSTALLDAIGATISRLKNSQQREPESARPEKTMFVIITDGLENASREYSRENVKRMIEQQQRDFGWEFIFMGANMDAISEAKHIGIRPNHAVTFNNDSTGTRLNYAAVSRAISSVRSHARLDDSWKSEIEIDRARRTK